ncbi:hypothetical protein ACS0TY_006319 [Phlomoides rotata]
MKKIEDQQTKTTATLKKIISLFDDDKKGEELAKKKQIEEKHEAIAKTAAAVDADWLKLKEAEEVRKKKMQETHDELERQFAEAAKFPKQSTHDGHSTFRVVQKSRPIVIKPTASYQNPTTGFNGSTIKSLSDRFHRYSDMVKNNTLYSGLNVKHRLNSAKSMNKPYSRRPPILSPKKIERRRRIEAEENENEFKMLKAFIEEEEIFYALKVANITHYFVSKTFAFRIILSKHIITCTHFNKISSFDPPPARVFAWRVLDLKEQGVEEELAMYVADMEYRSGRKTKKKAYARLKQIAKLQGKTPPPNPYPSAVNEIQNEKRKLVHDHFYNPQMRKILDKLKDERTTWMMDRK